MRMSEHCHITLDTYLTAFSGGKPLKTTMQIVTAGLKCPPDVAEQVCGEDKLTLHDVRVDSTYHKGQHDTKCEPKANGLKSCRTAIVSTTSMQLNRSVLTVN